MRYHVMFKLTGVDKDGLYAGYRTIWYPDIDKKIIVDMNVILTGDIIIKLGRILNESK
jgi:hypothetical protein